MVIPFAIILCYAMFCIVYLLVCEFEMRDLSHKSIKHNAGFNCIRQQTAIAYKHACYEF